MSLYTDTVSLLQESHTNGATILSHGVIAHASLYFFFKCCGLHVPGIGGGGAVLEGFWLIWTTRGSQTCDIMSTHGCFAATATAPEPASSGSAAHLFSHCAIVEGTRKCSLCAPISIWFPCYIELFQTSSMGIANSKHAIHENFWFGYGWRQPIFKPSRWHGRWHNFSSFCTAKAVNLKNLNFFILPKLSFD